MTRGLLLIIVISTSCRSTTLSTENLSYVDNELFCKGTKNMLVYLKQSQEIRNHYTDILHNKEQIGLKIDNEVFKGLPFGQQTDWGLESTDTVAVKRLNYECSNQSDKNPDFDVTFSFFPKKRILTAVVWTILTKSGYRSGYIISTRLEETGQLGQMKTSTIQE